MATNRSAWQLAGAIVGGTGAVITMIASFFLAGEDYYPGRFYIERQGMWDNNQYYLKYTFLLTWLTLLNLVIVPLIFVAGVVALLKRLSLPRVTAPPGWDVSQVARRVKMGVSAFVLFPVWLAVTGIVVFWPDTFSPLGGFASIFLLLVPTLPMIGPALLFEAIIAPRYVVGVIGGMRLGAAKRNQTPAVHFQLEGEAYSTTPHATQGIRDGMRVGLVSSGFFRSVSRIARLDA